MKKGCKWFQRELRMLNIIREKDKENFEMLKCVHCEQKFYDKAENDSITRSIG